MSLECAICMDDIHFNQNNFMKTECGHCFHTSCIMRNVAHNGFGCPYCRTEMAEMVEDDDSEVSEDYVEGELYDDYSLRGLRFFTDNLEGVEHDHEDVLEEQEDEEQGIAEAPIVKPDAAFVTQKLVEQGVTMEQLIKILLRDHDEYEAEDEEFERVDEDMWGRMRNIISNYQPPGPADEQEVQVLADSEPEPKISPNVTLRRPMTHV